MHVEPSAPAPAPPSPRLGIERLTPPRHRAHTRRSRAPFASAARAATPACSPESAPDAPPVASETAASSALLAQPVAADELAAAGDVNEAASAASTGASGQGLVASRPVRRPRLLAGSCDGFFPPRAQAAHGEVEVTVRVDATGHAELGAVLKVAPSGDGFARAARACVSKLRFSPARDASGSATLGEAKLRLRFDRALAS